MADARRAWAAAQPSLDPGRPVFLDETRATTDMARRYGRAPRGRRALDAGPAARALEDRHRRGRAAGRGRRRPARAGGRHRRPGLLLAPALRPGDVVAIDNLGSHEVAGVREAVEAAGATPRHLPPCSPDLNPVEQAFAKLKALLRDAAARTTEALRAAVAQALGRFPPVECARHLAHCGYGQSG